MCHAASEWQGQVMNPGLQRPHCHAAWEGPVSVPAHCRLPYVVIGKDGIVAFRLRILPCSESVLSLCMFPPPLLFGKTSESSPLPVFLSCFLVLADLPHCPLCEPADRIS